MNIKTTTGIKLPQYKIEFEAGVPLKVDDELGKKLLAHDPSVFKETSEEPSEVVEKEGKRKRGESSFEKVKTNG